MALFDAMAASASGMTVMRTWLDSIADNLSNTQTVALPGEDPFRSKLVIASAREDGLGVQVSAIRDRDETSSPKFDPEHPYADENGMVQYPGIDMGVEMTNMVAAQRAYQANVTALQSARDAYQAALRLGR
jgi:flagellar basal-body rod protein FlgC